MQLIDFAMAQLLERQEQEQGQDQKQVSEPELSWTVAEQRPALVEVAPAFGVETRALGLAVPLSSVAKGQHLMNCR